MESYDLTEEQVGNMLSIISLAAQDEVRRQVSMSRGLRKAENEVHSNVFLNVLRNGKQCT